MAAGNDADRRVLPAAAFLLRRADPSAEGISHVRHRRIHRSARGRVPPAPRPSPPRIPGVRLLRSRHRPRGPPRGAQGGRQDRHAGGAHGRRRVPAGDGGDRAHAMGHPRAPQRRQRASSRGLRVGPRRRPQRDHRQLPRAAPVARRRGPSLPLPDRHRGHRPPHRALPDRRPARGGAPGEPEAPGRVRARLHRRERAGSAGGGPPRRLPARDRIRQGRDLRRLRHPGAGARDARGRGSGRRGHGRRHP